MQADSAHEDTQSGDGSIEKVDTDPLQWPLFMYTLLPVGLMWVLHCTFITSEAQWN